MAITNTLPLLSKPLSVSTTRNLSSPSLHIQWTKTRRTARISVATGDLVPPVETLEKVQQIVPAAVENLEKLQEIVPDSVTSDDITPTVISGLLFLAFIALSVLTIGVVYLSVQDFLQKRENEKIVKEEEERKKKESKMKKKKKRDRSKYMIGPKGPIKIRGNYFDDDDDDN